MMISRAVLFLCCIFSIGLGQASPLRLDYAVSDIGGGRFNYDFSLVLDNHDNSWAAGQGWGWLTFGDSRVLNSSPLTDFVIDSTDYPVGPWTYLSYSSGGHNGPTFGYVLDYWRPGSVGASLTWSGSSTANLAQGQLLFTTIFTSNGARGADFEVANRIAPNLAAPVPEPEVYAMLLAGLGLMSFVAKRRQNAGA